MKVLMLNGSSHINGTTMAALTEVGKALEEDGIEYEIFQIGGGPIADCLGCGQCTENGCIFSDDAVNAFRRRQKPRMDTYSVRRFTMRIQVDGSSRS